MYDIWSYGGYQKIVWECLSWGKMNILKQINSTSVLNKFQLLSQSKGNVVSVIFFKSL